MTEFTEHALYRGQLGHQRFQPKPHGFGYPLHYFWINAATVGELDNSWLLAYERFAAFSFRRHDYLKGADDLLTAVQDKLRELGANDEVAFVFVLTPLANWGYYFSPITLYYGYDAAQQLRYVLAEVSNTPWNERHYYLHTVTPDSTTYQHDKAFHVSPFNPMDMQYHWQLPPPAAQLRCQITNYRQQQPVFSAWMKLSKEPISSAVLKQILIRAPWPNVLVMIRIYWHALKLWVKGNPVYAHSKKGPS